MRWPNASKCSWPKALSVSWETEALVAFVRCWVMPEELNQPDPLRRVSACDYFRWLGVWGAAGPVGLTSRARFRLLGVFYRVTILEGVLCSLRVHDGGKQARRNCATDFFLWFVCVGEFVHWVDFDERVT